MTEGAITQSDFERAADPYYEPYFCDSIQVWAEEMKMPEQWAAEIGVPEQEMFNWISVYPEFARAYAIAMTKLRAAFTDYMLRAAEAPNGVRTASLIALIAKQRFRDLYGDPAPGRAPPAALPMRDVTPGESELGVGSVSEMEHDALIKELEALRRRQADIEFGE